MDNFGANDELIINYDELIKEYRFYLVASYMFNLKYFF